MVQRARCRNRRRRLDPDRVSSLQRAPGKPQRERLRRARRSDLPQHATLAAPHDVFLELNLVDTTRGSGSPEAIDTRARAATRASIISPACFDSEASRLINDFSGREDRDWRKGSVAGTERA